ncbi:MAG TPA: DUF1385 domain-containing protein [Kofleriaceae bacterium]|nr:DUF1385 domain-containing protein [Kofleriaceae bacterium]
MTAERINVGGQAVIEGVMMRSPRSFAVVCRRPDGSIVIKEQEWRPLWSRIRPLRWPLLRGGVVLLESLVNGISALTFSADQQLEEERPQKGSASVGNIGMVAISLIFGLLLFVGVPHLATWGLGGLLGFDTSSAWFHLIDGAIKLIILVGYLAAISLLPDVRRVFQYHGAEHTSIYTYEQGLPLTVDNARKQTRFHPRCGTSFLLIVIMVSVVLFSALLQFPLADSKVADNLLKIAIKIPLMFPVAGLSYELIKLAGKHWETSRLAKIGSAPGMWLQKITTREPDDDQLEIALISIRKTLWREQQGAGAAPIGDDVEVYHSAADVDLPLAA